MRRPDGDVVLGDRAARTEVIERLANRFQLTQGDREELLPSGTQRRFNNRVNWVAAHFRKAGLIEMPPKLRRELADLGLL